MDVDKRSRIWEGSDSRPNRSSACFVRLECFKAIEHYEKFLELWKDADPGIAEVEDAKMRLAGIHCQ